MKPDGASIEHQVGHVREGTWPQTRRLGEVDDFAQFAPQPFLLECVRRYRRIAAIRASAATSRKAIRDVRSTLQDLDRAPIRTHHELAIRQRAQFDGTTVRRMEIRILPCVLSSR